jgi:pimeloyl-ACP methyl ester carboxylesterase
MTSTQRRVVRTITRLFGAGPKDGERHCEVNGPESPPLPDGRTVRLGNRGETFVRELAGPPGSVPVVLLHGWGLTADTNFVDVYEKLSDRHRVIAPDVRMHGRASRAGGFTLTDAGDDVIALLNALEIDRAILCGYSMGGGIAADVVSRYPERVAGTVISGTAACYTERWRDRILFLSLKALRPLTAAGIDPHPSPLLLMVTSRHSRISAERRRWARRELARNSLSDVLSVGLHIPTVDLRPRLARATRRPCEYLLLACDRLCHPQMQHELAELLGAHICSLDKDHDVPINDPLRFAEAVGGAVDRLDDQLASGRSLPA